MDPKIRQIRRDRWLQIILAATNSGITKKQWCKEHQVSTKTFYRWQKIIREEEAGRFQQMRLSYSPGSAPAPTVQMLPSVDTSDTAMESAAPVLQAIRPEIILQAGKYQMVIGGGITENTLATVLRVIGNA